MGYSPLLCTHQPNRKLLRNKCNILNFKINLNIYFFYKIKLPVLTDYYNITYSRFCTPSNF